MPKVRNKFGGDRFAAALLVALVVAAPAGAQAPAVGDDQLVSGSGWVRHDGGMDAAIAECDSAATSPALDDNQSDDDADSNDGGSRRFQEEPFVAVDPTDPNTLVSGFNNGCSGDLGAQLDSSEDWIGQNWLGLSFSRNGGRTWTNSLVPGYPADTSAKGRSAPIFGRTDSADPVGAFDRRGNLFVGGLALDQDASGETSAADMFVATYGAHDGPNGYPVSYSRTVLLGNTGNAGIFNDKPSLEVDRTGGPNDGNVYACWTRFVGNGGRFKIFVSRSTDSGLTFSHPVGVSISSEVLIAQGCDIAIEHDGDVYVTYRSFDYLSPRVDESLAFVRSTDGGKTFASPVVIPQTRGFVSYEPGDVDFQGFACGDGNVHCQSDFVFHRQETLPRSTADQRGGLPGIYVVYNAVDPSTMVGSETSYSSAERGEVGQSRVYVVRSLDDGRTWSSPTPVDRQARGHQFFPDADALDGRLAIMWEDSRTDPAYSVQFPIGNMRDAQGRAISSGDQVSDTFLAYSSDGVTFASAKVSDVGQQSEREAGPGSPFHGDYNWVSLAKRRDGSLLAYAAWADTRDVVHGADPREEFDDGFDAELCWQQLPDATFQVGCSNGGGTDYNIYGNAVVFPPRAGS